MASSTSAIQRVIKEEGGFQAGKADTGNYYNGALIGTKYGITPAAYAAYYKRTPTQDTIKNLSVNDAVPIYKKNYWDKISGDELANDSVADLMLFMVVNSGTGQVKSFKQIGNETAGKNIFVVNTKPLTSAEVKLLNALPQDVYFNKLKKFRENFYKALVARQPSNQVYLKGWLNRLDGHQYSGASSGSVGGTASTVFGIIGLCAAVSAVAYVVNYRE